MIYQSGVIALNDAYVVDGIRSSKTVGSTTYNYLTQNGQVVRQSWGFCHCGYSNDWNNG